MRQASASTPIWSHSACASATLQQVPEGFAAAVGKPAHGSMPAKHSTAANATSKLAAEIARLTAERAAAGSRNRRTCSSCKASCGAAASFCERRRAFSKSCVFLRASSRSRSSSSPSCAAAIGLLPSRVLQLHVQHNSVSSWHEQYGVSAPTHTWHVRDSSSSFQTKAKS